jgi:hypothetical protein
LVKAKWRLKRLCAGEAMQPPSASGEDGLAAGQVVRAGVAVAVDEGLIALYELSRGG